MTERWPTSGPWVIAATSAEVDWRIAAAALAAAAEVPVGAVLLGPPAPGEDPRRAPGDDPLRPQLSGVLDLPAAAGLELEHARGLVRAMSRAYGLVLVAAPAGLLVPVGRDDWTLADLAAAVGAPAVVVTGPGPDAVNHTTLALGALAGQGIVAAVVTVGDMDVDGSDIAGLPVTPAGRITDSQAEPEWLDPILHATSGPVRPPDADPPRTVSGKRLVLGLLAVFAAAVLFVCGLAWLDSGAIYLFNWDH